MLKFADFILCGGRGGVGRDEVKIVVELSVI